MISFYVSAVIVAGIIPYIAVTRKYLFQNNDLFILVTSVCFMEHHLTGLIYVSPPLSTLMKYLYIFNNNYSWYTIILLFTQYLWFSYLLIFEKKLSLSLGNGFILFVIASLPIFVFYFISFAAIYYSNWNYGSGGFIAELSAK